MTRLLFSLTLIVVATGAGIYLYLKRPVVNDKQTMKIGSVTISIEVAQSLPAQVQGLSGRESLCANCGMLFTYKKPKIQNFWMKDMKFPLDFVFIRGGRVVDILENVPSPKKGEDTARVRSGQDADMVLEVNAGFVEKSRIYLGETAKIAVTK